MLSPVHVGSSAVALASPRPLYSLHTAHRVPCHLCAVCDTCEIKQMSLPAWNFLSNLQKDDRLQNEGIFTQGTRARRKQGLCSREVGADLVPRRQLREAQVPKKSEEGRGQQ